MDSNVKRADQFDAIEKYSLCKCVMRDVTELKLEKAILITSTTTLTTKTTLLMDGAHTFLQ